MYLFIRKKNLCKQQHLLEVLVETTKRRNPNSDITVVLRQKLVFERADSKREKHSIKRKEFLNTYIF